MPAPAIKAIIISISLVTALGIAIYENPEVQRWLEEQRRRLVELLRGIGPELDPQTRREAEAFAFEGRTANNDESIRREMEASRDAAAVATGRSTTSPSATRRIPIHGPEDEEAAEERRRQGRDYLARRNQQIYELQQRRKTEAEQAGVSPPTTPTNFDAMVDNEGKLKTPEIELPSPPSFEPVSEKGKGEMAEVSRTLDQPLIAGGSSSSSSWANSGWSLGSRLANPFGDEFEMERSQTPKPPVPPKIELPKEPQVSVALVEPQAEAQTRHEELSYEEQLAIALSLSEAESSKPSATVRQSEPEDQDADLRAAIEASLRDMDDQQAAHAIANATPETPRLSAVNAQPLVDLTPDPPTSIPREAPRGHWNDLFDQPNWAEERQVADPPVSIPQAASEDDDELYRVTPQLTRARLATLEAAQTGSQSNLPYDPVHEAASTQPQQPMEASFYSAHSRSASPPTTHTLSNEQTPQLVGISEEPAAGARTTTSPSRASSFAFATDSDSETFASMSATMSRDQSVARSEISHPQPPSAARSDISEIEVIDLAEDSDVDMLSEEGDGVATPDSWSEIESRDGESEVDTTERRREIGLA